MAVFHARKSRLNQCQRGAEVELTEGGDIIRRCLLDQVGPHHARIVHDMRNDISRRHVRGRLRRRGRVEEIHVDRLKFRM
jgi:hypothetical protein